jgi:hypothetical protein
MLNQVPALSSYTVATLPAAGTANRIAIVTDAATAGSCTSGGGAARSFCRDTGSVWEPLGDGTSAGGGITTLNTLTAASQTFATGTAGTDFGISSVTSTHTFNLPSAGAGARGLLTSTDWTTFNNKVPTSITLTAGAGLSGGGDLSASRSFATDSTEADFLASGALICGAATQGKAKVHTTPLQYCDNAATPALQYAAYADSAGKATSTAAADTATTATTANAGDSATAFFAAGQIEAARGGTGQDSSGSTGVPRVAAGAWTFDAGISHLASSTSASLAAVLSDETGTGAVVLATSPTNVTLDVEGTGNVFTDVLTWQIDFAACAGAAAFIEWDDADAAVAEPTAACNDTGTIQRPSADFSGSAQNEIMRTFKLPLGWTGNIDVSIRYVTVAASPTGNVEWEISTQCAAAAESWDGDTTFNAAQTITDAVGAQNALNDAPQTAITTTTCAAEEDLTIRIGRDGTNDTNNDLAKALHAYITLRRTK